MGKGFKDENGKFHPITDSKGISRKKTIKSIQPSSGLKLQTGIRKKKDTKVSKNELRGMFELPRKEITTERDDLETKEFTFNALNSALNWGFGDIGSAVEKAISVDMTGRELSDLVDDFAEETGTSYEDIDVVAVMFDHILQNARAEIDSVLGFDIQNDADFRVAGNFMATTYDHSSEDLEELEKRFMNATPSQLKTLKENIFVRSFLSDTDAFL